MGDYNKQDDFDIIIIGAGISGINTAYRIHHELPSLRYGILETRDTIGGTWDLFRYPAKLLKAQLSGNTCKKQLLCMESTELFYTSTESTPLTGSNQMWTLDISQEEKPKTLGARFLVFGTGYYDYHQPLSASIPGLKSFEGLTIHPQFWPESCDYTGKRLVIIGSGATAITLPKLAEKAAKATMLQRSPSYIVSIPSQTTRTWLISFLPTDMSLKLNRVLKIVMSRIFFLFCRTFPSMAQLILRRRTLRQLPKEIPHDPHFKPRYKPWDQRLCVCPDGDFYRSLHTGKADIKTDTIKLVTDSGIQLDSGEFLDADIIITATGLKLQIGGGVRITVDQQPHNLSEKFLWHGIMLEDLPNAALVIEYTNASWTLGADVTGIFICRLFKYLKREGFWIAIPRVQDGLSLRRRKMLDLSSTYVTEAEKNLPKVADMGPWKARSNYFSDLIFANHGKFDESLELVKKPHWETDEGHM